MKSTDPEFIACKVAGRSLYDHLEAVGVELTGFGVGGKQEAVIAIRLMNEKDLLKVPKTWQGFEVEAIVTGAIVAL